MAQMRYAWAIGEVVHRVILTGLHDMDRWEEVIAWAWESEGAFGWDWIDMADDGTYDKDRAEFQFSDPDTAFACKMRWG